MENNSNNSIKNDNKPGRTYKEEVQDNFSGVFMVLGLLFISLLFIGLFGIIWEYTTHNKDFSLGIGFLIAAGVVFIFIIGTIIYEHMIINEPNKRKVYDTKITVDPNEDVKVKEKKKAKLDNKAVDTQSKAVIIEEEKPDMVDYLNDTNVF